MLACRTLTARNRRVDGARRSVTGPLSAAFAREMRVGDSDFGEAKPRFLEMATWNRSQTGVRRAWKVYVINVDFSDSTLGIRVYTLNTLFLCRPPCGWSARAPLIGGRSLAVESSSRPRPPTGSSRCHPATRTRCEPGGRREAAACGLGPAQGPLRRLPSLERASGCSGFAAGKSYIRVAKCTIPRWQTPSGDWGERWLPGREPWRPS
eukprot:scaffold34241_cov57-Phaeocystis_antarctica.AAC.1